MASSIDFNGIRANKYTSFPNNYIVINGHRYIIQCPKTIDENTTFYVAGRGAGGIGDTRSTFNAAKNQNVIVIAPVDQDGGPFPNTINVIDELSRAYNIEPRATFSGHSNSGNLALKTAIEYIKKYDTPTTVVLNDPSVYNNPDSGIDYRALDGSLIVAYQPAGGGCTHAYMDRLKKAAASGAQVLLCTYSNGDHGCSDDVAASMGAYDPANMQLINSGTYYLNDGTPVNSAYKYQWIDEKGQIHSFDSAEEAQVYMDNALVGITGTLYENCAELSEFASRYRGKNGTLASDLSFVSNSMDAIQSQITAHNDINYQKGSDDEAGVIGAMYGAANYYGAVTNELYKNLTSETNAVYAIANAIYQMDGAASMIAESTLTDGMKKMFDPSNPTLTVEIDKLAAATSDLYNNAKNAAMASGRYDELTTLLCNPLEEGGVGKINVSALESAISAIVPSLNSEVEKAVGLKAGVDDFLSGIGSSSILQGGAWDAVKANMESYQNLLDCNVQAAEFISDSIKTAMGSIVDYMGEDVELDDTKLPELKQQFEDLKTKIEEMKVTLTKMQSCTVPGETHTSTDPETGEPTSYTDPDTPCYTSGELSAYSETIAEAEFQRDELKKDIEKLEGLAEVVQNAQKLINDAIEQVKYMYENPVKDADGNTRFVANFHLDLSAYGLDPNKDYVKIIDDYYDRLNPKEEETIPSTEGNHNWGDKTGSTEPKTEKQTEAPTEKPTEKPTETKTEAQTEMKTEEVPIRVEPDTEQPSVIVIEETTEATSTVAPVKKPKRTKSPRKEMPTEVPIIEIEEEPDLGAEYYEQVLKAPEIINISSDGTVVEPNQKEIAVKSMGIASGVGIALGAAALGAHQILKNKSENDEEDEDFGYDK